jgi:uncharacterized protein YqgV (UPF0045/DUF77 family)
MMSNNYQSFEFTIIPVETADRKYLALHIPGTGFLEPLDEPALNAYRDYWEQIWVSESTTVYRGEYLAAALLFSLPVSSFDDKAQILRLVEQYIAQHPMEGYESGVHDLDATAILANILSIYSQIGLLRFTAASRGLAQLFWAFYPHQGQKKIWLKQAKMFALLPVESMSAKNQFGELAQIKLIQELTAALRHFVQINHFSSTFAADTIAMAGEYLLEELKSSTLTFTVTASAMQLLTDFEKYLRQQGQQAYAGSLADLTLSERWQLIITWLAAYANQFALDHCQSALEATVIFLTKKTLTHQINSAPLTVKVTHLLGEHRRIQAKTLAFQLDEFIARLRHFQQVDVPTFQQFRQLGEQIKQQQQADLPGFSPPRPVADFFPNQLIKQIYLPALLENLLSQLGNPISGDEGKSAGLLLLLSPLGYGKTLLIQYVASYLGLIAMRIDGAALGPTVDSIDPMAAPNALSRYELEKINFALAIGDPVMLFIDQIEAMAPALLQSFVSLAEKRTMRGIWRGKSRHYQLNDRAFCLVMAGNFACTSGETVNLPTALTQLADIYYLNEMVDGKTIDDDNYQIVDDEAISNFNLKAIEVKNAVVAYLTTDVTPLSVKTIKNQLINYKNARSQITHKHYLELFALSYLENALFSHPLLSRLIKQPDDIYQLIALTYGESVSNQALSRHYSASEINQITAIIEKLLQIQAVVFTINQHHLAAQASQFGTIPYFQLTGNYRNMNHLAAKITLATTPQAVEQLIDSYYLAQARALPSTEVEKNLLKFLAIRGTMTPVQKQRWQKISNYFNTLQKNSDKGMDAMTAHLINPISQIGETLQTTHQLLEKISQLQTNVSVEEINAMVTVLIEPIHTIGDTLQTIYRLLEKLSELEVNVYVTQQSTSLENTLQQLVEMIETTLLPIIQDFERKSKLDLMLFRRVKELGEHLKELQQELAQPKEGVKRYKPLSFKREE